MILNALTYMLMPLKEKSNYRTGWIRQRLKREVRNRKERRQTFINKSVMTGDWKEL